MTKLGLQAFFNPVVLLFLSGFAMARVMDTYEISRCAVTVCCDRVL